MRNFSLETFLIDLDNELTSLSQNSLSETNTASVNRDESNLVIMFNSVIDRHAPLRPMSRQENRLSVKPWITRDILTSIKTKNKLFKKYFKNKNFDTGKSKKEHYKKYLNKLTHDKNLAKRIYYKNSINYNNNNLSQTWFMIKEIIDYKNSAKKNCTIFCNNNER